MQETQELEWRLQLEDNTEKAWQEYAKVIWSCLIRDSEFNLNENKPRGFLLKDERKALEGCFYFVQKVAYLERREAELRHDLMQRDNEIRRLNSELESYRRDMAHEKIEGYERLIHRLKFENQQLNAWLGIKRLYDNVDRPENKGTQMHDKASTGGG
jgi:predicted RNase H-like nuclease (RuvC/YqgF family)